MLKELNFKLDLDSFSNKFNELLINLREKVTSLAAIETPSWDNFIVPLDDVSDALNQCWTPLSHLNSVANSPKIRDVYSSCLPLLSDYYTDLGQNAALFAAYQRLRNNPGYSDLSVIQQRVIELALRDFRLSGIDLNDDDKQCYKEIAARLSELTTQFENNIVDASAAWQKHITDVKQLAGVPEQRLQAMQAAASAKKMDGYLVTLDYPCYHDIITYADAASLRETIYQAFCTRASDQGPNAGEFDNTSLMHNILTLRQQMANLLGFEHYADLSLVPKMAASVSQAENFLHELAAKVKPKAIQDLAELQKFSGEEKLSAWDIAYYSEKMRQAEYALSQTEVKQYFPAEHVMQGLFTIINKLFGVQFKQQDLANLWNEEVRFYELLNSDGQCIGGIYCDLYARQEKRQGAWMDDAICRRQLSNGDIQLPIAFLNCNFAPATSTTPALLTHNDVETLFHEMGHCLQHLLTQINHLDVSGINNVAWDAVEFPSQFLESWVWQPESLQLISRHYKTGQTLPDALIEKMIAAKNFQSGLFLIRQIEFSLFDMQLHRQIQNVNVQQTLQEIRNELAVINPPDYNRFANGFSHIFAGGYAAGYYSYLWAEVLARDAFSIFMRDGLFDQTAGERFKETVLGLGGSEEAEVVFEKFMGRKPDSNALLVAYGFG